MVHQLRALGTRAHIMAAAAECFTRAGYDATGVAEICARAGVSKGAFYHHFPSKQAVFLALLDQWLDGLDSSMQAIRAPSETVPQRLIALASMVPQVLDVAEGQVPMFLEFWRQATKDPAVWQATIEPYRRFRAVFAALVREGVAEGTLRPVDPDLAAHVLVSLAVGLVLQGVLDPVASEWRSAAAQAIRLLLDGLATEREV
ncbi:MAG: TetR/AcrR family transcriptional regulator [Chloroflexi bacterium]|nr:TetR/AcrR family transcriptional regulator [Chloroflexota bacterium]